MENTQRLVIVFRVIAVIIYILALLGLTLLFGFLKGLGVFGVLVLFGWGMNVEQAIRKIEKEE